MKDAYDVLHQKESELARVRQEIDSLRIVASLLAEDPPSDSDETTLSSAEKPDDIRLDLEAVTRDGLFSSLGRSGLWKVLTRAS